MKRRDFLKGTALSLLFQSIPERSKAFFPRGSAASSSSTNLNINWVAEGDSITFGLGGQPAWPFVALSGMPGAVATTPNVNAPTVSPVSGLGTVHLNDIATAGISALTIVTDFSTRAGASFNPSANLNVLSLMIGTNTSGTSDQTAQQKYNFIRLYLRAAEAAGYTRKIIGSMIARDDDGGTLWNTVLVPLNTMLSTLFNSDLRCDAFINFASNTNFNTPANIPGSPFYDSIADLVHPSPLGEALMGSIAEPTVLSVLQGPGTKVIVPTFSTIIGDTSGTAALSNGNRTVTGSGQIVGFPALKGVNKTYFEVAATSVTAASFVGMCNETFNVVGTQLFAGLNSFTFDSLGRFFQNSSQVGTSTTFATGDTVAVAHDQGGQLVWSRVNHLGVWSNWNNNASANPATGVGGFPVGAGLGSTNFVHPAVNQNGALTSNFAASQQIGPVPSGFSAYTP
jgi:lysophospholipase L1-like esterase